jgi:hypothetical protein
LPELSCEILNVNLEILPRRRILDIEDIEHRFDLTYIVRVK